MTGDPSAWALRAIDVLQEVGSWTGRIHIHKLLYLSNALCGTNAPFEFDLYRYGPYSFDLDALLRDLTVCDLAKPVYRHPGYGPSYQVEGNWIDAVSTDVPAADLAKMRRLAAQMGQMPGGDLEVLATLLWFEHKEKESDPNRIVSKVREVKPRYTEEFIRSKQVTLAELRKQVA